MELGKDDVKELFRTLGNIEQKQEDMCAAIGQVQKNIRALPCEKRAMELGKRITWKQIMAIIAIGSTIIFSAIGLHYDLTLTHAKEIIIHGEHK